MTCLSCSTKQKVTVEYKDYRPLNLSSFVTLQNNILLDMPEEGRRIRDFHIGRLIVAKERIYAIDEKGDKIVMFNDKGKYLKSTESEGRKTSGNFFSIQDAAFDAQSQKLYACSNSPCQITVFDLNLNVEKTIPMAVPLLEIGLDGDRLYAIRNLQKGEGSELVVFDKDRLEDAPSVLWRQEGTAVNRQTPAKPTILAGKSLSPSENGVYVSLPQSNRICQIRNGKITATYDLDVSGPAPQAVASNIYNICASDSFLIFNTDCSKSWFILNRKTGTCIVDEKLHNDMCIGNSSQFIPVQGTDNGMAYSMPAVFVSQMLQYLKTHREKLEQLGKMALYRPYLPFLETDRAPADSPMLYFWEIK